jgi:hypothetical protein
LISVVQECLKQLNDKVPEMLDIPWWPVP